LAADAVADPYLLEPVLEGVSRALEELAASLAKAGVRTSTSLAIGIPSEEIARAAREEDSDLIAMGTQGRTGLDHVLVGSTAERVIKTAPCPVLAVRTPSPRAQDGVSLRRLLVPVDFFQPSLDALETALLLARQVAAAVTLVHVMDWAWIRLHYSPMDLAEDVRIRKDLEGRLDRYADLLRHEGIAVDTSILGGAGPAEHIAEAAQLHGADLVVMGTHGKRGLRRALMGSVAEGVLREAPCPVLTVNAPRFAPGYPRVIHPMDAAA
jgi:nucleotide-binding universal stress UspA family protein